MATLIRQGFAVTDFRPVRRSRNRLDARVAAGEVRRPGPEIGRIHQVVEGTSLVLGSHEEGRAVRILGADNWSTAGQQCYEDRRAELDRQHQCVLTKGPRKRLFARANGCRVPTGRTERTERTGEHLRFLDNSCAQANAIRVKRTLCRWAQVSSSHASGIAAPLSMAVVVPRQNRATTETPTSPGWTAD